MRFKARLFSKVEITQKFMRFLLLDRVMIEKDNVVLISGKRGDGKTTLGLKLILGYKDLKQVETEYNEEINKRRREDQKKQIFHLQGFKRFDLEEDMVFTRKGLQHNCKNHSRSFILADEAVTNVARRNSMTKANKVLHEIITINRKNYNTIFFCLPSIEDFDISILQYVTHWIHIDDRGLGALLLPEAKTIFGRKTWDIDKMKKIYDKFVDDNPGMSSIPYWLFDNFRGYIRFKALPKSIEKKYLQIANKKKNEDTEEQEKIAKPQGLEEDKRIILREIADKIVSKEIVDTKDYYAYCEKLDFNKQKLNREMNELLARIGDGRTATRAINDNKKKEEKEYHEAVEAKGILY